MEDFKNSYEKKDNALSTWPALDCQLVSVPFTKMESGVLYLDKNSKPTKDKSKTVKVVEWYRGTIYMNGQELTLSVAPEAARKIELSKPFGGVAHLYDITIRIDFKYGRIKAVAVQPSVK
jgi:hypothetical protein